MSGATTAYHLRTNKYIDRGIFAETLNRLSRCIDLSDHAYISMAGAYLEDCKTIHKTTKVRKMLSFDEDELVISRQTINRPYSFIELRNYTSKHISENISQLREELWTPEQNTITWLDYTKPKDRAKQLTELSSLVRQSLANDIIRVTMNAHRNTLGEIGVYQRLTDSKPETFGAWRYAELERQLGNFLPIELRKAECIESNEEFMHAITKIIHNTVVGSLENRPELQAFPLLCTGYADGQYMATYTFLIIESQSIDTFTRSVDIEKWDLWAKRDCSNLVTIEVPHLSVHERHIMNQLIHGDSTKINFVSEPEVGQYIKHYGRYPTFAPLEIF